MLATLAMLGSSGLTPPRSPATTSRSYRRRACSGGVDLGSTHGTLVNDQPVKARRLRSGDRILAGQVELELHTYVTAAG